MWLHLAPVASLAVAVEVAFHLELAPLTAVHFEPDYRQLLHSPTDLDLVLEPLTADHMSAVVEHQHLELEPL